MPIFNASLTFSFLPTFFLFSFFHVVTACSFKPLLLFFNSRPLFAVALEHERRQVAHVVRSIIQSRSRFTLRTRFLALFSLCSNCSFSVAAAASCSGRCTVHARRRLEGTGALWMQQRGHVANIKSTLVSLQ